MFNTHRDTRVPTSCCSVGLVLDLYDPLPSPYCVYIIDTDVLNLFNHIRYMMKGIFMLQARKIAIAEKFSD